MSPVTDRNLSIFILLLALCLGIGQAQLLDRLFNTNSRSNQQTDTGIVNDSTPFQSETRGELGQTLQRLMGSLRTVNVPAFYTMNKTGSSLGINVLSGLVKVERGGEAERNGLVGPRPLSVRVFGVPVFERGQRVRPPASSSDPVIPGLGGQPDGGREDDELPLDP